MWAEKERSRGGSWQLDEASQENKRKPRVARARAAAPGLQLLDKLRVGLAATDLRAMPGGATAQAALQEGQKHAFQNYTQHKTTFQNAQGSKGRDLEEGTRTQCKK